MTVSLKATLPSTSTVEDGDVMILNRVGDSTYYIDTVNIIYDMGNFEQKEQIISNTTRLSSISAQMDTNYTVTLSTVKTQDTIAMYYKTLDGTGPAINGTNVQIPLNHTHASSILTEDVTDEDVSPKVGETTLLPSSAIRVPAGIYRIEAHASFVQTTPGIVAGVDEITGSIIMELFQANVPNQIHLASNVGISTGHSSNMSNYPNSIPPSVDLFMFGIIRICSTASLILRASTRGTFKLGVNSSIGYTTYPVQLVIEKLTDDINAIVINPPVLEAIEPVPEPTPTPSYSPSPSYSPTPTLTPTPTPTPSPSSP